MQGIIKSYLSDKGYGFIKGDDGKDYFFHGSSFNKNDIAKIADEARLKFEAVATPKGYSAKKCILINPAETATYVKPDRFFTIESGSKKGWELLERGDWIVHGTSEGSPAAAKEELVNNASRTGANALCDVQYYKTTGSSGNYNFTIHNYKGRITVLGKKNACSKYKLEDMVGINKQANTLKVLFEQEAKDAKARRNKKWLWVILGVIPIAIISPTLAAGLLTLAWLILGEPEQPENWLERG